jgi:hypothetical protein
MYYRLTRSAITVAIVSLAIAFLTYMLAYSVCVQERSRAAQQELKQSRLLGEWVSRLSAPDPLPVVLASVTGGDSLRLSEYCRWGHWSEDSVRTVVRPAMLRYREFLDFFAAMRPAPRAVLLGDANSYHLPDNLLDPEYYAIFRRQLGELGLVAPMGGDDGLRSFLQRDWPVVRAFAAAVWDGQQAAANVMLAAAGDAGLVEWAARSPDSVAALSVRHGYSPLPHPGSLMREQAQLSLEERSFGRSLGVPEARAAVARLLDIDRKSVDVQRVSRWLRSRARSQSLHEVVVATGQAPDLPPPDRLFHIAAAQRRTARLQLAAGPELGPVVGGLKGIPQATRWLVIVSFLVCAVGICNTMFMSVTERFTEIATMKCLGAMDGFVMTVFVFEASLQGVVGSVVGLAVGIALAALRGLAGYGPLFFESFPWGSLGIVAGGAIVVGIALSALSAVGPAWMAARLAPMEAMRVE